MATVALMAGSIVDAAPASAEIASAEGRDESRIAWSRYDATFSSAQILSAEPDGSHRRTLTRPGTDTWDIDPVVSPDGRRILVERDHPESADVVLVDADGRHERVLDLGCLDPCADDVSPNWTADGQRIAFTRVIGPFDQANESARSAVRYTANADGTDVRRLSEPGIDGVYEDYRARFSPDGRYLTFVRVRNAEFNSAIFRMDANGANVRQLTPWELDADTQDLSVARSGPSEGLVVFETFGHGWPDGEAGNIATVPTTCTSIEDCTSETVFVTHHVAGPANSFNPSWSPDGRRLAYVEFVEGDASHPPLADIWTARLDGTGRRQVTTSPRFDFRPDWGPGAPTTDEHRSE